MSKISGQLLISGQFQDICDVSGISGISGQLGALDLPGLAIQGIKTAVILMQKLPVYYVTHGGITAQKLTCDAANMSGVSFVSARHIFTSTSPA